ncbi:MULTISPECIES: alpha/beta hydrolase [Niastella]|uniref:Alpha/beta hydrolase n=1 Tax=Niastella soli TaxID=2821487 RepID=A0ABS3YWF7_9BACT|nr:alpha/beta hydrolase [Niastella soli]MBO9202266.1 alpha/beta hydrolase [Niastella soli]
MLRKQINKYLALLLCLIATLYLQAQVEYPYPVKYFKIILENRPVQIAYMDVQPDSPVNKTVLLFHGKNFNGYYWKDVMAFLTKAGFRVIVPDQPGWGKSDKPDLHYSFHMLAYAMNQLLDSLHITNIDLVGHSMGGMLAARFAMQYPDKVTKLVLEDPIGLEDYKRFVPYQTIDQLYDKEIHATYESYKQYQQTYYPQWRPEYEQYVQAQADVLKTPDFSRIALVNATTYQMIYEQPVCYEWGRILAPTLLMIGTEDRTVLGKSLLSEDEKNRYGQYPALAKKTKEQIPNALLYEVQGVGHIPHIQDPGQFRQVLLTFLK